MTLCQQLTKTQYFNWLFLLSISIIICTATFISNLHYNLYLTSGYAPGPQAPGGFPQVPGMQGFPGAQMLGDPMMTNMAMQYGSSLADQGKDYVSKNVSPSLVMQSVFSPENVLKWLFLPQITNKPTTVTVSPKSQTNVIENKLPRQVHSLKS